MQEGSLALCVPCIDMQSFASIFANSEPNRNAQASELLLVIWKIISAALLCLLMSCGVSSGFASQAFFAMRMPVHNALSLHIVSSLFVVMLTWPLK